MLKSVILASTLLALSTGAAQAGYLNLPNGRTAYTNSAPGEVSIEAGYVTGDAPLGLGIDYENVGARLNYQTSIQLSLFVDYGVTTLGTEDEGPAEIEGNPFGGGLFYLLPNQTSTSSVNAALKLSFHTADLERKDRDNPPVSEFTATVAELLMSGIAADNTSLTWYANVGAHKLDYRVETSNIDLSDTKFAYGGGFSLPLGGGLIYLGIDKIDELTYGGGIRIRLR